MFGKDSFGRGMADMVAEMMGCGSGTEGIHVDPESLDEYPKWV